MARSQRSAEKESFWRLAVEEFRESGLSVRAFCAREGLSEASFYSWRRTLEKRDTEKPKATDEPAELIPVDVVEPANHFPGCNQVWKLEVTTPGGFTLRFPPDIEAQQLGAVLGVIARCHRGASC